jgi:hypothetical protein
MRGRALDNGGEQSSYPWPTVPSIEHAGISRRRCAASTCCTGLLLVALVWLAAEPLIVEAQSRRVDSLIGMVYRGEPRDRARAAMALGRLEPGPRGIEALVFAARDASPMVRYAATVALERVGDASALGALRMLVTDPDRQIREAATAAIAAIEARERASRGPRRVVSGMVIRPL